MPDDWALGQFNNKKDPGDSPRGILKICVGWTWRCSPPQGGYQFRLCPLEEELTEACFQRTPVPFASETQRITFKDREERISGTFVSEGTLPPGSTWAMNPIPMCGQENGIRPGNVHTCPGGAPGNWTNFPYPAAGTSNITSFTIGDTLRIPASVKAGEYVLGWRWDSEQTPQVWGACSDVTIVAAR